LFKLINFKSKVNLNQFGLENSIVIDKSLENANRSIPIIGETINTKTNETQKMNNWSRFMKDVCTFVKLQFKIKS
jgi:hypothetical protein